MKRKKLFEVEINRYFKSVQTFWKYAENFCKKHGVNLNDWMCIEQFIEPYQKCNIRNEHKEWDEPLTEICKMQPYDYQLYVQGSYNFIMEFDFFDENSGHGYLYIAEYDTDGK